MSSKTPTFIAVTHKRAGFEQGIRAKSCQDARKYAVYLKRKKKANPLSNLSKAYSDFDLLPPTQKKIAKLICKIIFFLTFHLKLRLPWRCLKAKFSTKLIQILTRLFHDGTCLYLSCRIIWLMICLCQSRSQSALQSSTTSSYEQIATTTQSSTCAH